jgi:hypothetical protein
MFSTDLNPKNVYQNKQADLSVPKTVSLGIKDFLQF